MSNSSSSTFEQSETPFPTFSIIRTGEPLSTNSIAGDNWLSRFIGSASNLIDGDSNTVIRAGLAGDVMNDSSNTTTIISSAGNSVINRSSVTNTVEGGVGNSVINGGVTINTVTDAGANSVIVGGLGNDTLNGGNGDDLLTGRGGNNQLTGGLGKDTFNFLSPGNGVDTITDFTVADDKIRVSAGGFGGGLQGPNQSDLTSSSAANNAIPLTAEQFRLGSSAVTSSDRFLYNSATGALYFDVDGSGSNAPVQFAQLSSNLPLTSRNFEVTF
jgi:Ca2+-binding RTX toxin-like protein